jgi:hypothetical protein
MNLLMYTLQHPPMQPRDFELVIAYIGMYWWTFLDSNGSCECVSPENACVQVVAKNQGRYRRMRDKVELEAEKQGWRQELVESVVQQELQEEVDPTH